MNKSIYLIFHLIIDKYRTHWVISRKLQLIDIFTRMFHTFIFISNGINGVTNERVYIFGIWLYRMKPVFVLICLMAFLPYYHHTHPSIQLHSHSSPLFFFIRFSPFFDCFELIRFSLSAAPSYLTESISMYSLSVCLWTFFRVCLDSMINHKDNMPSQC